MACPRNEIVPSNARRLYLAADKAAVPNSETVWRVSTVEKTLGIRTISFRNNREQRSTGWTQSYRKFKKMRLKQFNVWLGIVLQERIDTNEIMIRICNQIVIKSYKIYL